MMPSYVIMVINKNCRVSNPEERWQGSSVRINQVKPKISFASHPWSEKKNNDGYLKSLALELIQTDILTLASPSFCQTIMLLKSQLDYWRHWCGSRAAWMRDNVTIQVIEIKACMFISSTNPHPYPHLDILKQTIRNSRLLNSLNTW